MGGMGFISYNHGTILRNNSLIDIDTLEAARVKAWTATSTARQ